MSKYKYEPLLKDRNLIRYGSPEAKANAFRKFPIVLAIILHYITLGIFSHIWLNIAHGCMPKIRRDDPSAWQAILAHLIPAYNIYWIFFTHIRLCDRINEQREMRELPRRRLREPAFVNSALIFLCGVALVISKESDLALTLWALQYGIIMPIYFSLVQRAVNDLAIITYMENLADAATQQDRDR